jgi:poly(3-hydroxybutyrate) depolymerase
MAQSSGVFMMYDAYQGMADVGDRVRQLAQNAHAILTAWSAYPYAPPWRRMTAYYELVTLAGFTHARPDYEIESVEIDGEAVPVEERGVSWTPFCQLLRFRREGVEGEPKVLLVAPMSGHFATLLRGTIRTLLRDCTVFVTDWINPRNVKLEDGDFSLEDYTQHLVDFVRFIGEDCHIVAVCQPTVSALAATAILARDRDGVQPASLTLMAGPIDARVSPTKVNELAQERTIEWFRANMIGTVPAKFEGRGRRVYPGFLQLCAFMSMNAERHAKSFVDLFHHRVAGDIEKADAIRDFYKEYFAIMDMSADFYLETVDQVFQRYLLPLGQMKHKGEPIDLRAIRKTFLLTVEGERDDICAVGQTLAAQDLCTGLRPYMKTHHLQAGAGHYGVFNGKRWEAQVYPVLRNHIQSSR